MAIFKVTIVEFMTRVIKILMLLLLLVRINSSGQNQKPIIMILPSDNWCSQRYFTKTLEDRGKQIIVPDYELAFREDVELGQVISKIGSLMLDKGYPIKDAEQELKNIASRDVEDFMTTSSKGSEIAEGPLDILNKTAKADIIIQIWWKVNKSDDGKSISFTLEAFDSYTSNRIATSTGTGSPSTKNIVPVLIEKAVQSHIDQFNKQLQSHFNDIIKNGREIHLVIKKWKNWNRSFDDFINNKIIIEHINDWMRQNTLNGVFHMASSTENTIIFEQVRIPPYNKLSQTIDARQFLMGLQIFLASDPYKFESKLLNKGLGEATLVIGEK